MTKFALIVTIFLLWVHTCQSLEVQHVLFDVCNLNPPVNTSIECTNKPPCHFCVKILSQNSVYRVADIITHSGYKWESDAKHILQEDQYRDIFVYKVLATNGVTGDPAVNVQKLRDVILQQADSIYNGAG